MVWVRAVSCCDDFECVASGFGGVCVRRPEQCLPEHSTCGWADQQTQPCCGNAKCQQLFGGSDMKCVEQKSCVAVNEVCGGLGQPSQQCCGNAKCQQLLGGSDMKCVEQQSCVAVNEVCGGPAQLTQQCCGNAKCQQLFGGSDMKCMEQQSCVAVNEVCGGPGQLTQQCCGNAKCQQLFGGSDMKCMEQQSCVAVNEVCGGPGQLTQQCCGASNAKCQTVARHSSVAAMRRVAFDSVRECTEPTALQAIVKFDLQSVVRRTRPRERVAIPYKRTHARCPNCLVDVMRRSARQKSRSVERGFRLAVVLNTEATDNGKFGPGDFRLKCRGDGDQDPSWPNLWGMTRVDVERAWARVEDLGVQSQEVVVAVIDTGVQLDHPDLRDMLWTNTGEIPGNGVDDDGNGYVDDVHGYNFYDYNGNPDDDNGHGSHCATGPHSRGKV
ncbi:unnamed protein product [Symbiodinium natans]|uniref:subtilisin n=1 Tax=Symbiodinium natans TaxID=878477 RepID=A0A812SGP8_9DINO|nr:unnamed protein product [Symbiodinium natans]